MRRVPPSCAVPAEWDRGQNIADRNSMNIPKELRRSVRSARRSLSEEARRGASEHLTGRINGLEIFRRAERIAAFLAFDGEIDPAKLVSHAWTLGTRVYIPIIGGDDLLRFGLYRPDTPLAPNRFGIPEPVAGAGEVIDARDLDLVLAPLVAFDREARRLGMGGGYYDRSFAFIRDDPDAPRPAMLGVAYELQKQDRIVTNPWDVSLDGVATEKHLYLRAGQTHIR